MFFNSSIIFGDIPQILTTAQEKVLAEYIVKCGTVNYALTVDDIRKLGFQYAKKVGADYPKNWNEFEKASRDWYYSFMKRNPHLSLKTPTPNPKSKRAANQ